MKKDTTALTVISTDNFIALQDQGEEFEQLIAEYFSDGMTEEDLHTIKIPAGGAKFWELPGEKSAATFTGVIIGQRTPRAMWAEKKLGEVTGRPLCTSRFGTTGVGDPGGDCHSCPFARWGSGRNDFGTACGERKILYVLFPEDTLPVCVSVPSTSFKNWRKFKRDALNARKSTSALIVEFSVEVAVSKMSGDKYGQVALTIVGELDRETASRSKAYAALLQKSLLLTDEDTKITAAPKKRFDLDEDDIMPEFSKVDGQGRDQSSPFGQTRNSGNMTDEEIPF